MISLIFGISVLILIFFSGWIAALTGPVARYLFFGLGFVFGVLKFNLYWV